MLQLDILTPDKKVYSGEVKWVNLPGAAGAFEVHQNHAAIISTLGKGELKLVEANNAEKHFAVDGGVVEVLNNKVVVLAEAVTA
ncbi:MAG: synthase subunit epsilon [Chitinophagaceae bacterium]|nr:synthase subunit epsilon [Chitinophagaceae bacterium]